MNGLKGGLALAYMGFLAYMSLGRSYPPALDRALATWGTTLLHLGGYALLANLLAWAVLRGGRRRPWLGAAAAFAYGGLLELAQLLVPGRTASVLDLGINLAGAIAGGGFFWAVTAASTWQRAARQEPAE